MNNDRELLSNDVVQLVLGYVGECILNPHTDWLNFERVASARNVGRNKRNYFKLINKWTDFDADLKAAPIEVGYR